MSWKSNRSEFDDLVEGIQNEIEGHIRDKLAKIPVGNEHPDSQGIRQGSPNNLHLATRLTSAVADCVWKKLKILHPPPQTSFEAFFWGSFPDCYETASRDEEETLIGKDESGELDAHFDLYLLTGMTASGRIRARIPEQEQYSVFFETLDFASIENFNREIPGTTFGKYLYGAAKIIIKRFEEGVKRERRRAVQAGVSANHDSDTRSFEEEIVSLVYQSPELLSNVTTDAEQENSLIDREYDSVVVGAFETLLEIAVEELPPHQFFLFAFGRCLPWDPARIADAYWYANFTGLSEILLNELKDEPIFGRANLIPLFRSLKKKLDQPVASVLRAGAARKAYRGPDPGNIKIARTCFSNYLRAKPVIQVTHFPAFGEWNDPVGVLSGYVEHSDPRDSWINFSSAFRVLVLSWNDGWHVEPVPLWPVRSYWFWYTDIHPGTEYAILLVDQRECVLSRVLAELPKVGGGVISVFEVGAKPKSAVAVRAEKISSPVNRACTRLAAKLVDLDPPWLEDVVEWLCRKNNGIGVMQ